MLPLQGITVIAVEQAVAAPFCSSRLADAGADVIHIERPEGDFCAAHLEQLIAGADVLLQNLKPGSMDKLGFSLARLTKDYPRLICCTITGYGDTGPYADRKAYDLLIQAERGLAAITGGA